VFHARTKYVEVNYHFVLDRVAKKKIQIHLISFKDQIGNVLTKSLPHTAFVYLRSASCGQLTFSLRGCIMECVVI
jgi:hypothetical protein